MFAACSKMLERIRERVPHRRCGYTETPFAQFSSCSRDHKIATRRWTQVCSSRGCSHRSIDVTEIGRADAVNAVPSQYGDFVADSVLYREPVEDISEDRCDVVELPRRQAIAHLWCSWVLECPVYIKESPGTSWTLQTWWKAPWRRPVSHGPRKTGKS